MSKVNTTPRGLQSLLGNVNQGENPNQLNQVINPTTDLFPFWSVDKTRFRVVAGSVAHTIGQGVELVVPEGKLYIPTAVSTDGFNLNGQGGSIGVHITDAAGNVRAIVASSLYLPDLGATQTVYCGVAFPNRFVMTPGQRFRSQWLIAEGPTTNATLSIDLYYVELDA